MSSFRRFTAARECLVSIRRAISTISTLPSQKTSGKIFPLSNALRLGVKRPRSVAVDKPVESKDVWLELYEEKRAKLCGKQCKQCNLPCFYVHPEGTDCPCNKDGGMMAFAPYLKPRTATHGPIEFSFNTTTTDRDNSFPTMNIMTFTLAGHPCSIIATSDRSGESSAVVHLSNFWTGYLGLFSCWSFSYHGFEDAAIEEVYSRAYEATRDVMEATRRGRSTIISDDEDVDSIPVEEVSPGNKMVLVATWRGRVKIAGEFTGAYQVVMAGKNELEAKRSLDVKFYGNVHDRVTVREGNVCGEDVFMMVPKSLPREVYSSVAKQHDNVQLMAQSLLKHGLEHKLEHETIKGAWAARINDSLSRENLQNFF